MSGIITKVSGPLVVAEGLADCVSDVVPCRQPAAHWRDPQHDRRLRVHPRSMRAFGPSAPAPKGRHRRSAAVGGARPRYAGKHLRRYPASPAEIRALTGRPSPAASRSRRSTARRSGTSSPSPSRASTSPRATSLDTVQETSAILPGSPVPRGQRDGQVHRKGEFTVDHVVAVLIWDYNGRPVSSPWSETGRSVSPGPAARNTPRQAHEQRPAHRRHALPHRQGRHRRVPAPSAPARPSCSTSSPSGPT